MSFCIPFNPKEKPERECEICHGRGCKCWELHDTGLNGYIKVYLCDACILKEYEGSCYLDQVKEELEAVE